MPGKGNVKRVLVVEVGGTTIRAARFQPSTPTVVGIRRAPAPNDATEITATLSGCLAVIRSLWSSVLGSDDPDVVAVAFPGPIDRLGRVLSAPTLLGPIDEPIPLAAHIAELWPGAEIVVMNDLTASGYTTVWEGERDFAIITIGSGIGHKVFVNGQPAVGPGGRGGELGHLRVDWSDDAIECDCGGRGHLGAIASGRGTLRIVRRHGARSPQRSREWFGVEPDAISNEDVARVFRSGNSGLRALLRPGIGYLAAALAALHVGIGVESFRVVGGFAHALGEPYRRELVDQATRACWDLGQDWDAMISLHDGNDDHAMMGAGLKAAGLVG